MKIAVFLACLSLALAARKLPPSKRIVGGSDAPVGSRPYQASILYSANSYDTYCGGTLVHPKWVVSAGNCVQDTGAVYVGLGYTDLGDKTGTQIIKGTWHLSPQFDYNTLDGDLALIELDTAVPLSDTIQTIQIASSGSDVPGGTKVLVSGWGSTSSDGTWVDHLQQVVLEILDRDVCNYRFSGVDITSNMLCTESNAGKDTCWSDEGGPVVTGYSETSHSKSTTLVGIVSWGWECGDANYPAMHNRVTNYCPWIASETGNDVQCK
ncbi:mite allergen Der f 3-like [Asterias rubens]|uniref:mite allergen Der f 3-like n=1 Tax=Asterias rubens TaxID=7604 RepID=UPI001455A99F|nr:mite allergen Der f 3-like [Asterias rubens]XP_033642389.1 mite allergen Der f 3-like [Asterias rubens]XP_033642390.1 mite allergen Der f 3-like [Asterias rubens]XP_033642391.1 mite allergen Der f 3-like [Asterias rubens]